MKVRTTPKHSAVLPFEPAVSAAVDAAAANNTMLQLDDLHLMTGAIRYVVQAGIPGVVVNCGIYKGGYALACAKALEEAGEMRPLWLYDTFEGMTAGDAAVDSAYSQEHTGTLAVSLDTVRALLGAVKAEYVQGDVKRTMLESVPQAVAFAHLDVDWYDNTLACLRALWPRLSPGGVLVVDDFGFWPGAKRACQEFFGEDAEFYRCLTSAAVVKNGD